MEQKNRLLDYDMVIYQNEDWFKFSLDSVLLVNFVTLNLRCRKVIDLASGNAPIPMLLTYRTKAHIDCIELQECVYELGKKSILENNLSDQINLICGDVNNINNYYNAESFDTVLCNPPYFNTGDFGFLNDNVIKRIARHEVNLDLDGVLKASCFLLKNGGNLAMVHRSERFIEIISKLREYNLEPKKIQFIYPKKGKNSDLFLIEAVKNGGCGLKILEPLIIHNEDGSYMDNIRLMFSDKR